MFSSMKIAYFMFWMGLITILIGFYIYKTKKIETKWTKLLSISIPLLISAFFLSTIFSDAPILSLFGDGEIALGTYLLFFLLILFFISYNFFHNEKFQKQFFIFITICTSIIAIYGLFQYINIDPITLVENKDFQGRIYSFLGNPNFLAQLLIFPLMISVFSFSRSRKYYWAFFCLLFIIAIILTRSRSVIMSILFVGYFFTIKRYFSGIKLLVMSLLVVFLVVLSYYFLDLEIRSFSSRLVLWKESWPLIFENIFFGSGLNTFYQGFQAVNSGEIYKYEPMYLVPFNVHNQAIKSFIEMGLLGFITYLFHILILLWIYFKKNLSNLAEKISFWAIVSYSLSMLFSFGTIDNILYLTTFWAILFASTFKSQNISIKLSKFKILIIFSLCIIIGTNLIVGSIKYSYADILLSRGVNKYLQGEKEVFDLVLKIQPFNYKIHKTQLYLTDTGTDYSKVLTRFGMITGKDYQYYLLKAKQKADKNERKQSNEYFLKAKFLAPNNTMIMDKWGHQAYKEKNYELASKIFEELRKVGMDNQAITKLIDNNNQLFFKAMYSLANTYLIMGDLEKYDTLKNELTKRREL